MALFNYDPAASIDYSDLTKQLQNQPQTKSRSLGRSRGVDLSKQFLIFQIQPPGSENAAIDLSKVKPQFEGGADKPDMLMQMEMICFNLAATEKVNSRTRATMRMIVHQMDPVDEQLAPLVWVVSAGLQLYDLVDKKRAKPSDLKMDFHKPLGQRPIEIPKGRAMLTFDVYKHREPKWWNKIFKFLGSKTGKALTSTIGFPGVTQDAVGIINGLLNQLSRSKTDTIFKSSPLKLALNKAAKERSEAGGFIKVGVLNPGLFVLCQGGDLKFFQENPATYYEQYGILVPQNAEPADFLNADYKNPFEDKTYAIFRIGMQPTKLKPQMIFDVAMPELAG